MISDVLVMATYPGYFFCMPRPLSIPARGPRWGWSISLSSASVTRNGRSSPDLRSRVFCETAVGNKLPANEARMPTPIQTW